MIHRNSRYPLAVMELAAIRLVAVAIPAKLESRSNGSARNIISERGGRHELETTSLLPDLLAGI